MDTQVTKPAVSPPRCMHCNGEADLVTGKEVYLHRPDLHAKPIWRCPVCDAHCGCHPGTRVPLGRPANAELRAARSEVHKVLDPLWKEAWKLPEYAVDKLAGQFEQRAARRSINRRARDRAYRFLASRMKLTDETAHTGMFDLAECQAAIAILKEQTPGSIRAWAKDRHL